METSKRTTIPDIQKMILDYLPKALASDIPEELDGVSYVAVKPSDMGDKPYALVLATGGPGVSNKIMYRAQITVDAYATTAYWAGVLARLVSSALHQLPLTEGPVAQVESPAPAEFPDPDTDLARYTATFQINTRLLGGDN